MQKDRNLVPLGRPAGPKWHPKSAKCNPKCENRVGRVLPRAIPEATFPPKRRSRQSRLIFALILAPCKPNFSSFSKISASVSFFLSAVSASFSQPLAFNRNALEASFQGCGGIAPRQESIKMMNKSTLGVPRGRFCSIFGPFWDPFGHCFFDVFRNGVNSRKPINTKVFLTILPLRSHHCSTYVSLIFNVLFGTPLGEHFWRPKRRSILQLYIKYFSTNLEAFCCKTRVFHFMQVLV